MSKRHEYVCCVARDELGHVSWCQRRIASDFSFTGANHAALSNESGSRLRVCPDCAKQLCFWLRNNAASSAFEKPPGIIRVLSVKYSVKLKVEES